MIDKLISGKIRLYGLNSERISHIRKEILSADKTRQKAYVLAIINIASKYLGKPSENKAYNNMHKTLSDMDKIIERIMIDISKPNYESLSYVLLSNEILISKQL
jgi:dihydroorotate dehydrogenase